MSRDHGSRVRGGAGVRGSVRRPVGVLCLYALVIAVAGGMARAEVFHVYEGDSIQAVIGICEDGDEIVVHPGTYYETINFLGKAIWLHSSDGPLVTTIDAAGLDDSVVICATGESSDSILEGFTLRGGIGFEFENLRYGGGMYSNGASPTVRHCIFRDNAADLGGGMYNATSHTSVTDCQFIDNSSTISGGGMCNRYGSNVRVDHSLFRGNSTNLGGGMYNSDSDPVIRSCTFTENAANEGGGMCNMPGNQEVTNCLFSRNTAVIAAGMVNYFRSNVTVTNCIFTDNTGSNYCGGMYIFEQSITDVRNSIFWGDHGGEFTIEYGSQASITYSDIEGGQIGVGNIDADPLFIDPENGDYHLSAGSPCIDAGNNNAVPPDIFTDLDGRPRFVDDPDTPDTGYGDPPVVDMGAYEYQTYVLEIHGVCPGPMGFVMRGATPHAPVAFLYALGEGSFEIPPGNPCAGTVLGLDASAQFGRAVRANADGRAILRATIPPIACGGVSMQAIDLATCATTNVVLVQ